VFHQIQDNFMLHLSEEDAIKQFEALLNQTSVLTAVFDAIHDWVSLPLVPLLSRRSRSSLMLRFAFRSSPQAQYFRN
jgi:hypothetical protein